MPEDNKGPYTRFEEYHYNFARSVHEYNKSRLKGIQAIKSEDSKIEPNNNSEPEQSEESDVSKFLKEKLAWNDGSGPIYGGESNIPLYFDPDRKRFFESRNNDHPINTDFQKDYSRIIHSLSFRRLQGKTQLIPCGENYKYRTRLTHTLEVADIAVRIALRLNSDVEYFRNNNLNVTLVHTGALCHDIGHPPFGHSGERVLNKLMKNYGGFEGNAQTIHVISRLENRLGGDIFKLDKNTFIEQTYKNPRGLNLTYRTIAATLKYNQMIPINNNNKDSGVKKGFYEEDRDIVEAVNKTLNFQNSTGKSQLIQTIECQIMDLADDIAYSVYDLEDTMEARIINPFDFFSISDKLLFQITDKLKQSAASKEFSFPTEITTELVARTFVYIFQNIIKFGDNYKLDSIADRSVFFGQSYREGQLHAKNPMVRKAFVESLITDHISAINVTINEKQPKFSTLHIEPHNRLVIECLKLFNRFKVINSPSMKTWTHKGEHIIKYIFGTLSNDADKHLIPDQYKLDPRYDNKIGSQPYKRLISDIIANMTDDEAIRMYKQLHSSSREHFFNDY